MAAPTPLTPTPRLTPRRAAGLIIAAYVVLGIAYGIAFPIFESWDELQHFDYVRHLAEARTLPVQEPNGPPTEFHQPPGYYAITALLTGFLPADDYRSAENPSFAQPYWEQHNKNRYIHPQVAEGWPWRGTALNVHAARFTGIAWGALALVLAYHLAGRLLPDGPGADWLRVGVVAFAAFNPTFLYVHSMVNNEIPGTVLGAALGIVLIDLTREGITRRRVIIAGALLGLAALVKWTLVPWVGVWIGAVAVSKGVRAQPRRAVIAALAALGIMLAIGGWWYVRNTVVYGEPTAVTVMCAAWDECDPEETPFFLLETPYLLTTYWGSYGSTGSIRMWGWAYALFIALTVGGVAGVAWAWWRGLYSLDDKRAVFVLGSAALGFIVSTLVAGSSSKHGVQYRWVLGAHVSAAVLVVNGWWHILQRLRLPPPARIAWTGLIFLQAVAALIWFIVPAYAPPTTVDDPAALDFAEPLALTVHTLDDAPLGAMIGATLPERLTPGGTSWVRLCWEVEQTPAASYWFFLQVVAGQNRLAAADSIPGRGNYPTVDWQPGTAHCTDWPLSIPQDIPPGRYDVIAGLFERETLARLPVTTADGALHDPPVIGAAVVDAVPAPLPDDADVIDADFGPVRLRGLRRDVIDGALHLTLFWEALQPLGTDYTVFIHRTPPDDASVMLAQGDGPPRSGRYPTTLWPVGALVEDVHILPPPEAGIDSMLRIGLYNPADGTRLPGPDADAALVLPE